MTQREEANSSVTFSLEDHETVTLRTSGTVLELKTAHQFIQIAEIEGLGQTVLIDGCPQISWVDQARFNEALVHVPLCSLAEPKRVFFAGVASGGNVREALKHPSIDDVVAVDIDQEAVEFFASKLAYWNGGALTDPRVALRFMDARRALEESEGAFDAIFVDLPDPKIGSSSRSLFTAQFYQAAKRHLRAGGILVTQAGRMRINALRYHAIVQKTCGTAFSVVKRFSFYMPCYYEPWAFVSCSDTTDPSSMTAASIDSLIAKRGLTGLKFYDGRAHEMMFFTPRDIINHIPTDVGVLSD